MSSCFHPVGACPVLWWVVWSFSCSCLGLGRGQQHLILRFCVLRVANVQPHGLDGCIGKDYALPLPLFRAR